METIVNHTNKGRARSDLIAHLERGPVESRGCPSTKQVPSQKMSLAFVTDLLTCQKCMPVFPLSNKKSSRKYNEQNVESAIDFLGGVAKC